LIGICLQGIIAGFYRGKMRRNSYCSFPHVSALFRVLFFSLGFVQSMTHKDIPIGGLNFIILNEIEIKKKK